MNNSYIYSCYNHNCETNEVKFRSEKTSTGTRGWVGVDNKFRIDYQEGEDEDQQQDCPICGQILRKAERLNVGVFLGTSLMSTQQKQNMLMKRSRVHSNKGEQRDHRAAMIARQNAEFGVSPKRKK